MKPKILFLTESLRLGGGTERIISSLSQYLKEDYELYLLVNKHFEDIYPFYGKYYYIDEYPFFKETKRFFSFNSILKILKIYKLIKTISPDIILSFLEISNILTILTKLIFNLKVPLIISIRCNPIKQYEKDLKHLNMLIKILYPLKYVNKIVAISEGVNKILQELYLIPRGKIKTIYNAIDIETIDKLKKEKISLKNTIFQNENLIKFVSIGRFRKEKGHLDLIKAFSKVKIEIPNSILILIGDGELKKEIKLQIHQYGLENDVILLGIQKNPFKYLNKSDIFVLPSKYEGFPNVLLEALTCGIPIISTDCRTGPKEILQSGKYGLLVEVNNINDLADKMIQLAKNEVLRKKFSKLSRERSFDFQWRENRKKWITVIETNRKKYY